MKIALLCDYGVDDAAATLYLFKYADRFEKIDILPVGGNVPRAVSCDNAKRILSNLDAVPENLRLVDTSSVPQPEEFLKHIHGKDGIGDILPEGSHFQGKTLPYDAWLDEVDEDYIILSLGPCTVTRDILNKRKLGRLVFMCGNIAMPPNHKGYEFNHGLDPEAFSECARHPHATVTLDTAHHPLCNFYEIKAEGGDLFSRFVSRAAELSRERGEKDCAIYDLVAAVYVIHPDRFTVEERVDPFGNTLSVLKYTSDKPLI